MEIQFKKGDLVKWTGEKWYGVKDNKRIDKIIDIKPMMFGGIEILTEETNPKKGETLKIGKGCPEYFTKLKKNRIKKEKDESK